MVIVLVPFFLILKTTGDLFAAAHWTFYTLLFLLVIGVFILFMVRQGKFTDYDVSKREQRPILFLVSMLLAVVYLIGLFLFHAPSVLFVVTFTIILGIFFASIINTWIKASMHVATIASLIAGLALIYGGFYYLLLLLIPLVGYIRVRAKRHTVPETIAGAMLGLSLSLIMYTIVTVFLD
jgi:hypothetical protein